MNDQTKLAFKKLEKALKKLEIALEKPIDEDRTSVDATIQRFEFSIELFWKFLSKLLGELGVNAKYPKDVLREAYQGYLIDDEQSWLQMVQDRNQTSHTYDEDLADEIYKNIKKYYPVMKKTFENLATKYFYIT